ncbi:DUF1963 domain-containing protein [Actinomadura welshii]
MDHEGKFRRAALALGVPDDEISGFFKHLRLAIRLGGSRGGDAGRFGGLPRLPVGEDWPSHKGVRLPFIFSVDCAALPEAVGFGLPADGSLLFFLDYEEDHLASAAGDTGYARVVHVPAGAETAEAEPLDTDVIGEQYDVSATLVADLPDWLAEDENEDDEDEDEDDDPSPFQEQLARDRERDFPHLEVLRALAYDLWPQGQGLASAYMGEYVEDELMTGIAEQVLAGREKAGEIVVPMARWYTEVEKEKHRLASEWISLADFLTDSEVYYGRFVIHRDDLAAGRLDKAISATKFTE